jgi:hypothetical protein
VTTDETIRILARQAARWATASQQDANPFIAMLHANYAVGYVTALRQVANDADVRRVTGYDAAQLDAEVAKIQDNAALKMSAVCPGLAPSGSLVRLAKEGLGRCC